MACFQSAEDGGGKLKPEQAGENRNARLKLKEGGEIMKSDVKKITLYLCDPQKNTECPKTICQIPHGCFFTAKKQFAVTDENGKPTKEESYKVKMPNSCCPAGNTGERNEK